MERSLGDPEAVKSMYKSESDMAEKLCHQSLLLDRPSGGGWKMGWITKARCSTR